MLHSLKPLGYVRYGDDFVLWYADEGAAREPAIVGTQFLHDQLGLTLNLKYDRVQPAHQKLAYLGVDLWPNGRRLQKSVRQRIDQKLDPGNAASYQALIHHHEPTRYHRRVAWKTLDKIDTM